MVPENNGGAPPDQEIDDTGVPLTFLADLRESPRPRFLDLVRASVERRLLGTKVIELGWFGLLLVVFEYLGVASGMLNPAPKKGEGHERS